MAEIKQNDCVQDDCGCGCVPGTKKDSKTQKPEAKKSEKQKTLIRPSTDRGGRNALSYLGYFYVRILGTDFLETFINI